MSSKHPASSTLTLSAISDDELVESISAPNSSLYISSTMGFHCPDARIDEQGENLKGSTFVPMLVSMPKTDIIADSPDQFRQKLRLPRFAKPSYYELRFHPDLVSYTFSGVVAITVDILQTTRFLVINVVDLTIDHASIHFKDLAPTEVVFFKDDQIMVLGFGKELPLGEGVLRVNFNGTLNDDLRGFYRSKYEYKGKTANMAVTQLQAVNARRCFPYWDEPAFKAKFKITLQVPSELVALSNMPVSSEIVDGAIKTVHFEESPLMSTYLVAMVVGIFDLVEGVTSQGTKVHVYTEVGKSEQGKFALDVGVKFLDLYNGYFGTPYALPKLDMIGIPDFSNMGMENYGLVTFQVLDLLFDGSSSTPAKQHEIANTVAHELAHQWFGNLVTMEWWTHAWLNEGFATWMSYHAVDYFFPQWNVWMEFLESTISTLRLDSLAGSHPIEVEIHHTSEIGGIFDDIIYIKGASIVGMLQSYLGADPFQKALASYIKKYAHSNANTEDLWAVLEAETGRGRNPTGTGPFFIKWILWIWLVGCFYHVKYDRELSAKLQNALEANMFSSMEKIGILENARMLSMARKDSLASLLYILYACRKEADYSVLTHIDDITSTIAQIFTDAMPKLVGDIKQLFIKVLIAPAEKLGWDPINGEDDQDVGLRKILLVDLVELGHDKTINEGVRHFNILTRDHNTSILSPDTRTAAYLSMMQTASSTNRSGYDDLRRLYRDSADREEKLRILAFYMIPSVLSYCSDKDIVLESLDLIFTNEVPNKDAIHLLEFISIDTRETAWSWLKENWDHILKVVPEKDLLWCIVNNIVPLSALKGNLKMVNINMRWIEGIRTEPGLAQAVHALLHKT
ncbi:hypothetical protein ACQ4PT_057212 [Festuca glaucescens]